jgi:hypothetical protein
MKKEVKKFTTLPHFSPYYLHYTPPVAMGQHFYTQLFNLNLEEKSTCGQTKKRSFFGTFTKQ